MRTIFKIHPLYYLFLFIVLLTANIRPFIEFSILILVHELGHVITSLLFKWKIDRIVILPYGMITFFKDNLNKPIIQEFIILIMGPLIQIIFNMFFHSPFSNFILFVNLLPIYPLDGSKIIFLLFNKIIPYYKSYIYTILLSFLTIIYLLINNHNLLIVICLAYLFYHLISSLNNLHNILISFCYERYKYHLFFNKKKYLNGFNLKNLYRQKYHYFKIKNKIVKESDFLAKMFDK